MTESQENSPLVSQVEALLNLPLYERRVDRVGHVLSVLHGKQPQAPEVIEATIKALISDPEASPYNLAQFQMNTLYYCGANAALQRMVLREAFKNASAISLPEQKISALAEIVNSDSGDDSAFTDGVCGALYSEVGRTGDPYVRVDALNKVACYTSDSFPKKEAACKEWAAASAEIQKFESRWDHQACVLEWSAYAHFDKGKTALEALIQTSEGLVGLGDRAEQQKKLFPIILRAATKCNYKIKKDELNAMVCEALFATSVAAGNASWDLRADWQAEALKRMPADKKYAKRKGEMAVTLFASAQSLSALANRSYCLGAALDGAISTGLEGEVFEKMKKASAEVSAAIEEQQNEAQAKREASLVKFGAGDEAHLARLLGRRGLLPPEVVAKAAGAEQPQIGGR